MAYDRAFQPVAHGPHAAREVIYILIVFSGINEIMKPERETLLQCRGAENYLYQHLQPWLQRISVWPRVFNVLFLVLGFPLGAPNTLLKHVIERSIWGIVVGEGSWWGWGFSLNDWVLDLVGIFPWLWSFGLTFRLLVLREYSYLGVYLSAVTIWSMPFVFSFMLLMPRYALT